MEDSEEEQEFEEAAENVKLWKHYIHWGAVSSAVGLEVLKFMDRTDILSLKSHKKGPPLADD